MTTANTTHVSTKFQVVIPKNVRLTLKLSPQEKLIVYSVDENTMVFQKPMEDIKKLRGSFKFPKNYLQKERLSW